MRIEWLESAIIDLQRLKEFILPLNHEAAQRAFRTIRSAISPLEANPRIGKPVEDLPGYHDIFIPFGSSGYVLRYLIQGDTIFIIAVKHGKEAGFTIKEPALWVVKDPVEEAYGMLADGGPSLAEELLKERRKDFLKEEQRISDVHHVEAEDMLVVKKA
jgi:plasmid stabilization system protein ParE